MFFCLYLRPHHELKWASCKLAQANFTNCIKSNFLVLWRHFTGAVPVISSATEGIGVRIHADFHFIHSQHSANSWLLFINFKNWNAIPLEWTKIIWHHNGWSEWETPTMTEKKIQFAIPLVFTDNKLQSVVYLSFLSSAELFHANGKQMKN